MPILSRSAAPGIVPAVLDAIPDAVLVVDADGLVRFGNARAEVLLGLSRHSLVGHKVSDLVPGLGAVVEQLLVDRGADRRVELTVADLPVEVWLARLGELGDDGEGRDLVAATIRDDSERRSLREASTRMRDDLFASVSHELRTPLTSIIGYTEVLVGMGETAVSGRAAELLEVIERNALRELRLVDDLLTIASLGSPEVVVEAAPTDLTGLAGESVAAIARTSLEAGVELTLSAPEEVWVCGDADRLAQVVRNLVCNAVKFTPLGGHVAVEVRAEVDHAELVVADQGVGLDVDELPRVFEGLYRGSHAVAAHLPGAGLGLPIVKGIVEQHGGHVDVQSAQGEGTRVVVRLPLASSGCC